MRSCFFNNLAKNVDKLLNISSHNIKLDVSFLLRVSRLSLVISRRQMNLEKKKKKRCSFSKQGNENVSNADLAFITDSGHCLKAI